MQNPSPRMMKIYRPAEGNIFVQPDQAGAEALIVAYLAPRGRFRELIDNNIKTHTYVASHIFRPKWLSEGYTNIDLLNHTLISKLNEKEEWQRLAKHIKKDCEREYFIGKKSCHSFNYRMRPSTFREDVLKESDGEVDLTKEESETFHATYHSLFQEISNGWWPMLEHQVRKTGYLFNLFGYPLYCQGPYTEKTWRELTSWVPQSTVGCITAIAFGAMQMYIEENGLEDRWHLRNDKHDSFLVECPEEDKHECCMISQAAMKQDLVSPSGEQFQMKSEVSWGYNWMKQGKDNPEGMREYEG